MPKRLSGSGDAQTVASLGGSPLEGSLLVLMYGGGTAPGGWTDLSGTGAFARFVLPSGAGFQLLGRIAGAGESGDYSLPSPVDYVIVEFTGGYGLVTSDPETISAQGPSMHAHLPFNPASGNPALVLGAFIQDNTGSGAGTPDAGYTLAERFLKVANGWQYSLVFLEETSTGSYEPGITAAVGSGGWGGTVVALTGGEAAVEQPPTVDFEICGPDGTNCILIERATAKKIRVEYNGTGSGAFQISRYDVQATNDILAQGNIVKCTFPEIDPDPLFEFILEEGDFKLISSDEEGGELLDFGGRGTLQLLGYAILGHEWLDTTHPKLNFPSEGVWRWSAAITNATAAGILRRIIDEAQLHTPPALADVVHGGTPSPWSDTTDSLGNAFYDLDGEWEIPIGQDLLTAAMDLAKAGLFQLEMRPGFELWAYDEMGFDRTGFFGPGVVRFEKGKNIGGFDSTELVRQMHNENFASRVLLSNKRGHLWVPGAAPTPLPPYVKEKFLDLRSTSLVGDAARAAARALLRGEEETQAILVEVTTSGPNGETNDEVRGYYYPGFPGTENGKYWLGDLITLHTGENPDLDFQNATFKVYAITLYEDETGHLAPPVLELNAGFSPEGTTGSGSVSEGGTSSGGGSGAIVTTAPHVHSQYQIATDDHWHQPCRVATTGNVTISTALNAGDTVDGVTLAAGDRVLVPAQSTASQNGIYIAGATPARAPDFDEDAEVLGSVVLVEAGTAGAGKIWRVTNTTAPDVGTDAINFAEVGAGSSMPDGTDPGDILVWDGDSWEILAVGTDGQIIYADSGETLGLLWDDAPTGGGGVTGTYIGKNSVGASSAAPGNRVVLSKIVTPSSGVVLLSIGAHMRTNGGNVGNVGVCVWDDASGSMGKIRAYNIHPTVSEVLSSTFRWVDIPISFLFDGSTYHIGMIIDNSLELKYDTGGNDRTYTSGGWWLAEGNGAFYTESDTTRDYSIRGLTV